VIHIDAKTEPTDFNDRVRIEGQRFLRKHPKPTAKQWRSHSYWRKFGPKLHDAYGGICAYSCHWIPYDTGADTVEHYKPKDLYQTEAYDWANYRLVCATLNGRKGVYEDVLDPFVIQEGLFTIDFPSMLISPRADLEDDDLKKLAISTIRRLGLNDEGTCLKSRVKWVSDYCDPNPIPFEYLQRHAPFIAAELLRQGIAETIREIFMTG
jgi:hypothetical protein